jgi:hypothetical protein
MIRRDALNPFSRRFADVLFQTYPDWQQYVDLDPWPNHDPGCFVVWVPSPADPDRQLWVGTDGDEITVGFGPEWHSHYGTWTGASEEKSFGEALSTIAGILAGRLIVATGMKRGEPRVSSLIATDEEPDFGSLPLEQVVFSSWSGTHDRTLKPPG